MGLATIPSGPNSLRVAETILSIPAESGMTRQSRAWAMDMIALFVTADGLEQAIRAQLPPDALAPTAQAFANLPAESFPHQRDLGREMAYGTGDQRRRWMIEVLLTGILTTDSNAGS